ncbi:TPA: DUF2235 domain-containing protein [Pseudomonas putida]|nr:DUF2235 domain-containing protein [Pseudomonas putida]
MSDALRFTVYFDGTGNNKDLDTPKGAHTNVARLFEADQAKGTNLARNSGHEPQQYDAQDRSGQSEKVYFDGVGSQPDVSLRSLAEGGTGLGGQGRIDQAYDAIVAFHNKYPDQKVDVNIVGFSRGAAQSRALANEFIDRGVPKLDGQGKPTGDYLIPPGEAHVNKLGIFDTVASYGYAMSDTHLGKNLEIGKNVDSTTHLVATNEYRDTFRLTSALRNDDNSRIEEVKFAGAHSQVGGGYRNDVLAAAPLAYMYESLQSAGVELGPLQQEDVQRIENYNELVQSPEKVQQALIDSRLKADSFKAMEEKARGLNPSASIGEASQTGRKATSGMVIDVDDHHILQKVGQTDQFVIHDRRDVDPSRNFQVGKSTAIVNEKGIGEVARDVAPKLELDMGLSQAMRR